MRVSDLHDVLMLLVPLMEKAPWVRKNKINGRLEKFDEHRWEPVDAEDVARLPKLHSQVWLTIYNLAMDSECRRAYELNSFRRETLLRLKRFINEIVVDQLPPLTNLHRTLEELSISGAFTGEGAASGASPFVIELVAEIHETFVRTYEGRWQEVADHQLRDILKKETPEELQRLRDMIAVPKELFEESPELSKFEKGETDLGSDAASAEAAAWEAIFALPVVRSTASFFAAARGADVQFDEVLVLSVLPQTAPKPGEKLKLSLHRRRQGQINNDATGAERAASEAAFVAKRSAEAQDTFALVFDAPKAVASDIRIQPFVSQKGAQRTPAQLLALLRKPGCETLLEMYSSDVAEFSVPVVASKELVDHSATREGLDAIHIQSLSLSM